MYIMVRTTYISVTVYVYNGENKLHLCDCICIYWWEQLTSLWLYMYIMVRTSYISVTVYVYNGENKLHLWLYMYIMVRTSYISVTVYVYNGENKLHSMWWLCLLCTYYNTLSWISIVLTHWNNCLWVDMSLHSDMLFCFWINQPLLLQLNAACLM
jgi:sRNA-binding regulator protein Hfq